MEKTIRSQKSQLSFESIFKLFVYTYFILLPIGTGLAGIIGNVSLMNYIAAIILLCGTGICIYRNYYIIDKRIVPTVLYFLYTIISYAWTTNLGLTWYVITNLVNGLLFFILNCYSWRPEDVKKISVCLVISQLIVCVAVIRNINSIFVYRLNVTIVSTIGIGDFAVGLCLLIAFWMNNIAKTDKRSVKLLSYTALGFNLLTIIMAGSRGALVMFFAMAVVWVLMGNYQKKTKVIIIIVGIIAYIVITRGFMDLMPSVIRNRLTISAVRETSGSGRFNVWNLAYDRFLSSNPLRMCFGYGFNSASQEIGYGSHGGHHDLMAHNFVVQTMIEGGVIGIILLIRMCFSQISDAWKRRDSMMLISLVGLFIAGLSNDMQVTRIWGMILTLNYMRNNCWISD